jgi:hypothetical protein
MGSQILQVAASQCHQALLVQMSKHVWLLAAGLCYE